MNWNTERVYPANTGPDCKPLDDRFPWMHSQNDLYAALLSCWAADTCAPRLRDRWTPGNPTLGQCSTTAFLVQDLFGGEVFGVPQKDGGVHCFNVVNGISFDLTSEQFLPNIPLYDGAVLQNREARFSDPERRARYQTLKERLALVDRILRLKGEKPLNALVVCYSHSGNTAYVAHRIARLLGAKVLILEPKEQYPATGFRKFLWCGKSAVMGEAPELKTYSVDWDSVSTVILGSPVWAGTFAPPLRTFFREQAAFLPGKQFAAFACSSGGAADRAIERMRTEASADSFLATLSLVDPKDKPNGEKETAILAFCETIAGTALHGVWRAENERSVE